MRFESFADILEALPRGESRERLRAFGLAHEGLCKWPLALLKRWRDEVRKHTPGRWKRALARTLYRFSLALYVPAFFLGLLAAAGLLRYNGTEPVNVLYFLFVGVGLPAVTLLLALLAIARARREHNPFLHTGPGYWIERWVLRRRDEALQELLREEPRLFDWALLVKTHAAALWFSTGMLAGLFVTVATQDVAFVWSTTLDISAARFAEALQTFAAPWRSLWPSAVPDAQLIEQSRYFRLGGHVSPELIAHADKLGTWWKFLAASVLFYTVLPRLAAYGLARWRVASLLEESLLRRGREAIEAMCTPTVVHRADAPEQVRRPSEGGTVPTCARAAHYDTIAGIGLDEATLRVLAETLGIDASRYISLGGAHTLEEDEAATAQVQGHTAVLVKSWEPPTRDALDTLQLIARRADRADVILVGLEENGRKPTENERANWETKLAEERNDTLCLVQ